MADAAPQRTPDCPAPTQPRVSAVIPVFNSEETVSETVRRTVQFFTTQGTDYEIILVNDGSHDRSWNVIKSEAESNPRIVAIDLLKNYGQHNANLCGLRASTGDYVITLDDDLQNPPEEIARLLSKAQDGHDVVFADFKQKQASGVRRIGSWAIGQMNRRIFGQPGDLVVSNFRIIRREVVDRICASGSPYPYITGLALLHSGNPANVLTEHHQRASGDSNYGFTRILRLVLTILFSYSLFPLRLMAGLGALIALASCGIGAVYLVLGLFGQQQVPGWTTLVVLLSFLNGIVILMLSMLGEYTVRILSQVSQRETYHVRGVVDGRP